MAISDNNSIVVQLWKNMETASLGTLEPNGFPHVSLITIAPQDNGSALLLLSDLARHTENIKRDSRASLLVQAAPDGKGEVSTNVDPLASERITIHGNIEVLPVDQQKNGKFDFIKRHPAAEQYINFADFNLYEFCASEIYLVGGFGRIESFPAKILTS